MNGAFPVHEVEVERATIGQPQCPLRRELMQLCDLQIVKAGKASFDFHVRRNGFTCPLGEVLIDVQVIVHAADGRVPFEEIAVVRRLFDQSLHVPPPNWMRKPGTTKAPSLVAESHR